MQTDGKQLADALQNTRPTTKSAVIRSLHGLIEDKVRAGVHLSQIVETLNAQGLDINLPTLKSYLYRLRQRRRKNLPGITNTTNNPAPTQTLNDAQTAPNTPPTQASHGHPSLEASVTTKTTPETQATPADLDALINPDPVAQAEELAGYENLIKRKRRNT